MGFFKNLFGGGEAKEPAVNAIGAPVAGEAVDISEVSDPTFGEKILGDGIAFRPTEGKVFAPCDATVDLMFDTGHAVSLVADCGAELLIHVGLDTVNLKGEHFTVHAHNGDKVKKGDLLIEFDVAAIAAAGYDVITPMVVCNTPDFAKITVHSGKTVAPGDLVLELGK